MKRSPIAIALLLSLFAITYLDTSPGSTAEATERMAQRVQNSQKAKAVRASTGSFEPEVRLLKPADFNKFKDAAKGKVLVINLWATWCGPCVVEFPEFVELDKKYRDQGVKVVGISADEVSDLKTKVVPFIKEQKALFDILVQDTEDPEEMANLIDKEWPGALPTTFVFDKQGALAYKRYGIIDRELLVGAIEKALK